MRMVTRGALGRRFLRHGLLFCLAVAVLLPCLFACEDPGGGDLIIETVSGMQTQAPFETSEQSSGLIVENPLESGTSGGLVIEPVTESETFGEIVIQPPSDPFENAAQVLRVDFLNVGDADSILLRMTGASADSPSDAVILIDTGETADYMVIHDRLRACGISTIDHLIITHYDNDHIGSIRSVLSDFSVKNVYMPAYVRDSRLYRNMMSKLDEVSVSTTVHRMTEDVRFDFGAGKVWINPTKLYEPELTLGSDDSHDLQENNYSLITSVTLGDVSFLFAGDAEGERMTEFVSFLEESEPSYDVLKVPHHGNYDKGLSEFLRAETGHLRYCVVSVGMEKLVENSLVTAMRATGAAAYYTYNGHVSIATEGTIMSIEQTD